MDRCLAAILSADVAGFSRLMRQEETGTLARLKDLRQIARSMGVLHLIEGSIRRALAAACQARLGRLEEILTTLSILEVFSLGFLPRILKGTLTLFKLPKHQGLLKDA